MDQPKLTRVTPPMAEKWLDANTGNRKLREGVAEKYAADMRAGNWTECLDPIAFYPDGAIANGQHRLWAIVESETTQQFFVVHGLSKAAGLNIDTGLARTLVDNTRISGLDAGLTNELVSLAMFYACGDQSTRGRSNAERLSIIQAHRPVLDWAVTHGTTGKGFRNAHTLAAIARAYAAGVDPERLIAFGKVMSSGFANGQEDSAAIALRNYVLARDRRIVRHELRDYFLKTQNAISYFLRRKPLNVIKAIADETYPLKGAKPLAAHYRPKTKRGRASVRAAARV